MTIVKPNTEAGLKKLAEALEKHKSSYKIVYKDAKGKHKSMKLPSWVPKNGATRLAKAYESAGYTDAQVRKA